MWDPHRGGDELARLAGAPGDVSHTDTVVVVSHQGLHHLPSQRVIHCTGGDSNCSYCATQTLLNLVRAFVDKKYALYIYKISITLA